MRSTARTMSCRWRRPPLCVVDIGVDIGVSAVSEQARRPPDKHSSGSEASNEERRKGAIGFNKDFPYINAKAACIKCGDGWMPGYWHRRARRQLPGMPRHFDPLADKIMCDHCRNKYPLGPYYFQEYKPYVTEAEVERVRMESRADYIDPAKKAAECFEKYCEQECKVPAAELDETTAQLCPPAPARKLAVGSMVQLNSAGLVVESDYDWSADPLAPHPRVSEVWCPGTCLVPRFQTLEPKPQTRNRTLEVTSEPTLEPAFGVA